MATHVNEEVWISTVNVCPGRTAVPLGFTTMTALVNPNLKYIGKLPMFVMSTAVSPVRLVPGNWTAAEDEPTEVPTEASMLR